MANTPHTDSLPPGTELILVDYIKDFNATASGRRLGIPAAQIRQLVNSEQGQLAIAEQIEERMLRTQIDSDWVLRQAADMFTADLGDIINPHTGALLPVREWPAVWRRMASGIDIAELRTINEAMLGEAPLEAQEAREEAAQAAALAGLTSTTTGHVKKFKMIDRLKVLEMIGKHCDVQAWVEKVEIASDQELNAALRRGRARAAQLDKPQDEELTFL